MNKIKIKVVRTYDTGAIYEVKEDGTMELMGIAEMMLAIEFLKQLESEMKIQYV